jgi:hypothetical protein
LRIIGRVGIGREVERDANAGADGHAITCCGRKTPTTNGDKSGVIESIATGNGNLRVTDRAIAFHRDKHINGGIDGLLEFVLGVHRIDVFDDRRERDVGLSVRRLARWCLGKSRRYDA